MFCDVRVPGERHAATLAPWPNAVGAQLEPLELFACPFPLPLRFSPATHPYPTDIAGHCRPQAGCRAVRRPARNGRACMAARGQSIR
eukprot:15219850-Alexandrium_andersonii.AAC.1